MGRCRTRSRLIIAREGRASGPDLSGVRRQDTHVPPRSVYVPCVVFLFLFLFLVKQHRELLKAQPSGGHPAAHPARGSPSLFWKVQKCEQGVPPPPVCPSSPPGARGLAGGQECPRGPVTPGDVSFLLCALKCHLLRERRRPSASRVGASGSFPGRVYHDGGFSLFLRPFVRVAVALTPPVRPGGRVLSTALTGRRCSGSFCCTTGRTRPGSPPAPTGLYVVGRAHSQGHRGHSARTVPADPTSGPVSTSVCARGSHAPCAAFRRVSASRRTPAGCPGALGAFLHR